MIMDKVEIFYSLNYDGLSSRELLLRSASYYSGIEADDFILVHDSGRKPYFSSHENLHFSVSHSGNVWIAAFADNDVGLDFQLHNSKIRQDKVAGRYFHPDEVKKYKTGGGFYEIWSRKEAYCKLFGWGIDYHFPLFNTCGDVVNFDGRAVYIKNISVCGAENYSCSLAYFDEFVYNVRNLQTSFC